MLLYAAFKRPEECDDKDSSHISWVLVDMLKLTGH